MAGSYKKFNGGSHDGMQRAANGGGHAQALRHVVLSKEDVITSEDRRRRARGSALPPEIQIGQAGN